MGCFAQRYSRLTLRREDSFLRTIRLEGKGKTEKKDIVTFISDKVKSSGLPSINAEVRFILTYGHLPFERFLLHKILATHFSTIFFSHVHMYVQ